MAALSITLLSLGVLLIIASIVMSSLALLTWSFASIAASVLVAIAGIVRIEAKERRLREEHRKEEYVQKRREQRLTSEKLVEPSSELIDDDITSYFKDF